MTLMSTLAQSHIVSLPASGAPYLRDGAQKQAGRLEIATQTDRFGISVDAVTPRHSRLRLPYIPTAEVIPLASAAIEFLTAQSRDFCAIEIDNVPSSDFPLGSLVDGCVMVDPRTFWQWPFAWIKQPAYPHPQLHVMSNGQYHPKRAAKPTGVVYERFIPWLGETLSFRAADPESDLEYFHRWMNDEQVNVIWEDGGDREKHRSILRERLADPHTLALIGCFNGVPFGYFEVYWAKENRLGPYYDAEDYDRGWHVAVGEPAYRGKQWLKAWLPSLMHFIFLDDPRTQRIVGEPRASHEQQIRNLDRSGFAKVKHFDFPHKRAMLVMLARERFFGDHLWVPAA
ncbi:MAG: GNAT family N-acetyltransferase [Phyllobacterium sp.]|uniref:GNAT family N-acetyltransferase n=1 Tax=Phyllobacterium sp. TaxID=1871046 RepID=UPI0030F3312A